MYRKLFFVPYVLYSMIVLDGICILGYIFQIFMLPSWFILMLLCMNIFGLITAGFYRLGALDYEHKMSVRGNAVFHIKGSADYNGSKLSDTSLYVFDHSLSLADDLGIIYFSWKYSDYDVKADLSENRLTVEIYNRRGFVDSVSFYSNAIKLRTLYDMLKRYSVNLDEIIA